MIKSNEIQIKLTDVDSFYVIKALKDLSNKTLNKKDQNDILKLISRIDTDWNTKLITEAEERSKKKA